MTDYFKGLIEGYKRSIALVDLLNPTSQKAELNLLKQLIQAKINLYIDENDAKLKEKSDFKN